MLNDASPLDPKAINNWLDLDNVEHLKAFKQVQDGKFWPVGFVPADVVFPTCWVNLIQGKIVDRWLDEQLNLKSKEMCAKVGCELCGASLFHTRAQP